MSQCRMTLAAATCLVLAAACGAAAPAGTAAGAQQNVRVVWSFEKDETAKQLPQFGYWGEGVGCFSLPAWDKTAKRLRYKCGETGDEHKPWRTWSCRIGGC